MPTDLHDRILDWHDELMRIAPKLNEMPAAARQAVYAVVEEFLREDAGFSDLPRLAHAA